MNLRKILATVLSVAAAGTVAVTALAASADTDTVFDSSRERAAWGEKQRRDSLEKLLDDGVVSQTTYDKMKAYLKENMPEKTERKCKHANILDTLLDAKVITQSEYDAMKAAMSSFKKPKLPDKTQRVEIVNIFDKLADDGVITESTAAAIKKYLEENRPAKPEVREKIKDRSGIFSKMLEAGVITQVEYDAIKAAMHGRGGTANRNSKNDGGKQ